MKNQLSSLSYYDGWAKPALHIPIYNFKKLVPCTYAILDPKILSKFESWKEEALKVSPNFQNKLRYMTSERALNRKVHQRKNKPMDLSLIERLYGEIYCFFQIHFEWTYNKLIDS